MDNEQTLNPDQGIAIIGLSGRFPGAKNIGEFWENLRNGVESLSFFSDEELEASGIDPATLSDPSYVKAGGILEDVDLFDAAFFGFTPREAEAMDPQQRLFLECAWEAIENAGYDPEKYEGLVGVYAGTSTSTYLPYVYSNRDLLDSVGNYQVALLNDKDHLTTYASYKLNLKGPSVAVQTACSTSLVAVCLACQSLLDYQCDLALAGGVSIALPQVAGYFYQEGGIGSPDGHCRAFDHNAQGTVGGNGIGIVALKRSEDAIADGDFIYAVIKGSATNNDGSSKVGYTAPSIEGQANVIKMCWAVAGVEPRSISYIEAHGTGTHLGDPIEVAALTQAFRATTDENGFCAIGSVKTNIGHLDSAAGIAGLIKTVLALQHEEIPPSLHFERANPEIDFDNSPLYVNTKLSSWQSNGSPPCAGVSSFGIGGTNAHVLVEKAPPLEASVSSRAQHLLVLSAKTRPALEAATTNLFKHLEQHPDTSLADVAYTLQVGRKAFNHRRAVVCRDVRDCLRALETNDPQRVFTSFHEPGDRPVVFMFSGQGAQYVGMGSELYQAEQTFRDNIDLCSELLDAHLGVDLRELLYPGPDAIEQGRERLNQTYITQPALFAIEYALSKLWIKWGVTPQAMIGHSIGEYVAACLAGVFSLEDALALVATRGRLMQQMPKGAMLAVALTESEAQSLLGPDLWLAAINSPLQCVVSGTVEAVDRLEKSLGDGGIYCRRLTTSHAFHSGMMDAVVGPLATRFREIKLNPPEIPYISNVAGTWITASEATNPDYWASHLRHTVRFDDGLKHLLAEPRSILLEIGPGQTLSGLARQHPDCAREQIVLTSLGQGRDERGSQELLLAAAARLWLAGVAVDWRELYKRESRRRTPLPTYPFERKRYWAGVELYNEAATAHDDSSAKKEDLADWFYVPSWKQSLRQSEEITPDGSQWLIFSDPCGVGSRLREKLEQTGQPVVTVTMGEEFSSGDDTTFVINPRSRTDYDTLFARLQASDKLPQKIVHLWSVTSGDNLGATDDRFEEFQYLGFYSLLFIAQAIGSLPRSEPVHIGIISSGVQSVTGDENICPEKATLLGPCKVIPQEYENISCRSIDILAPQPHSASQDRLIEQLITELSMQSVEQVVAYRGRYRWVQNFEAIRLGEGLKERMPLRQQGVYIITGGLGGIGLVMAKHLASTVSARLVLVGRSPFPENSRREQWLAGHDDDDATSRKIRAIETLEELGAEVMIVSGDVSDPETMRNCIKQTIGRFGAINGVIHAAGIAPGGIIQLKSVEEAASVLAPKAKGALILDSLLEASNLDFFMLCSSLNSIEGGAGQVDYCAANAFLDAFAHRDDSMPVVSVNWDAWAEVGMAVSAVLPHDLEAAREARLAQAILPDEGVRVFDRILAAGLSQVAVATTGISPSIADGAKAEMLFDEEENIDDAESAYGERLVSNAYVEPGTDVERTISALWQNLLGIYPVGIHDHFFDLGGHSLLAIQLISRLRESLAVELTVRDLFEAPTVAGLAARVEQISKSADAQNIDEMLNMVEQLSEEELRKLFDGDET